MKKWAKDIIDNCEQTNRLVGDLDYIASGFCNNCDSCGGLCHAGYDKRNSKCDIYEEYKRLERVIYDYRGLMNALDGGAKLIKRDNGDIVAKYEAQAIPVTVVYIKGVQK